MPDRSTNPRSDEPVELGSGVVDRRRQRRRDHRIQPRPHPPGRGEDVGRRRQGVDGDGAGPGPDVGLEGGEGVGVPRQLVIGEDTIDGGDRALARQRGDVPPGGDDRQAGPLVERPLGRRRRRCRGEEEQPADAAPHHPLLQVGVGEDAQRHAVVVVEQRREALHVVAGP